MTLAEIQEPPDKGLILLTGVPGAGKSEFGHQMMLRSIAADKHIIYVTSDQSPSDVRVSLADIGMTSAVNLNFVDAFTETVGLSCEPCPDTLCANCADLNSLSIAITKLRERTGKTGAFLLFDSLTSPYLFSGFEAVKFMRVYLSRLSTEGNSVLAVMDEGCSREEDLMAMMSAADCIFKMELRDSSRMISVVKHPKMEPTKITIPREPKTPSLKATVSYDLNIAKPLVASFFKGEDSGIRSETGDYLNLFWPNLAHWSGMCWDPKKFPTMIYTLNKDDGKMTENLKLFPLKLRIIVKLFIPKPPRKVKQMKSFIKRWRLANIERSGILEYLPDVSKTEEHHLRIYESSDCCGLENVGTTIASHIPPMVAGVCSWVNDWNAIETKCIGLGDPYCEFKVVPGEISELKSSLEKDSVMVEKIHDRLVERLMGFMLQGKPLVKRPKLGSEVHLHVAFHAMGFPHMAGERYRMAQRMGGAKSGKEIGERLLEAGLSEDEAQKRLIDFLNYCKVGKVVPGETLKIKENVESLRTKFFATQFKDPCCFFTTGFLNGFFTAVKGQHVREAKCVVAGDPYCEWEFR